MKWQRLRKKFNAFSQMTAKFMQFMLKEKKKLLLALMCGVGHVAVGMLEPWPLKLIFDNVFFEKPLPYVFSFLPSNRIELLYAIIISIVIIAIIKGIFYYYQQLLSSKAGQLICSKIRVELYYHLQKLSFSFHDRRRTGDLLARLTSDIRILRDILVTLPLLITTDFLLMVAMVTVMSFMDLELTLLTLLVIPILILLLKKYQRPMKKAILQQREKEGHLTTLASETLGAIRVVQGFHQENHEVGRFSGKNKDTLKSGLKSSKLEAKFKWASDIAVSTVTAIVLVVAGQRVLSGALSPGDVLVFSFYLRRFNRPLRRISRMTERMARGTSSGERVWGLLSTEQEIKDLPHAIDAPRLNGEIRFDHVSFMYLRGPKVLSDFNLYIASGESVAIVGPTGCGKSTIANLIPRFYEPTYGKICIDGYDIQDYKIESLRKQITFVFQEPILFATSIAENIAYGKPGASIDEIKESAQKAHIHNIIEALPEGYNTVLGERGGTLSGGQRQCVSIARAIIKNAPIVILDEPTSGLDLSNGMLVMDALHELVKGKTVVLISHQKETIRDVDRVIELENKNVNATVSRV